MKRNTDEVMPNTTNEIVDVFMKESLRKRKQLQEDERRELGRVSRTSMFGVFVK